MADMNQMTNPDIQAQMATWTPEQWQQYTQQYYQYYQNYSQNPTGDKPVETSAVAPAQNSTDPNFMNYYSQYYEMYAQYTQQMAEQAAVQAQQQFAPSVDSQASRCVWLGNVHADTTEGELHAAFAPYGMIENIKILPVKNCAFVRFIEVEAATAAHNEMSGAVIHGNTIKVGWGKNEPSKDEKKDDGPPPCRNLWLGNIGSDVSEDQIRMAFSRFGQIERVKLIGQKNCAFVNFVTVEAAMAAKKEMAGVMLGDKPLKINFGKDSAMLERYANVEAPPPEVPPPDDPYRKDVIDRLADYVARNGLIFENRVKLGLRDSPKMNFLFRDESDPELMYYYFKLWCLRHPDLDPRQYPRNELEKNKDEKTTGIYGAVPPPGGNTQSQLSAIQQSLNSFVLAQQGNYFSTSPSNVVSGVTKQASLPPEIQKLNELLANLVPTKDSIKITKTWMLQHPNLAVDIAAATRERVEYSKEFEQKLNLLYLIHDLLHHTSSRRSKDKGEDPASDSAFYEAFKTHVPAVLRSTYQGATLEQQEKVMKILKIWDEKRIFDSSTVRDFEDEMKGKAPSKSSKESSRDKERDHRSDRHRSDRGDRDHRDHRDREFEKKRRNDRDDRDRDYDRYEKRRHN